MNDGSVGSSFFRSRARPIALSFLLLEYLSTRQQELIEAGDQSVSVGNVLKDALKFCEIDAADDASVLYLLTRLNSTKEERKEGGSKGMLKAGRDFAGALAEWISKLNPEEVCYWLAGYDYQLADTLYSSVDVEDISEMISLKAQESFQTAKIQYEAALFGFGGGYKKTPKGDVTTYNLADASPEEEDAAIKALKELGF